MQPIGATSRSGWPGATVHPTVLNGTVPLLLASPPGRRPRPGAEPATLAAGVERALVLISEGRLAAAREALGDLPPDHDAAVLLDADIRLRSFAITTGELAALRQRFAGPAGPGDPRGAWSTALVAEHLAVRGDPAAFPVAAAGLAACADEPLPPLATAYARARLLRVAAAAWLAVRAEAGLERYERLHDEAVTLLLRYDLTAEATVTCAIAGGMRAVLLEHEPDDGLARLCDARAGFAAGDLSLWPTVLDYLIAAVALQERDGATADAALTRLERAAPPGVLGDFPPQGRALLRLLREGATAGALAGATAAADGLRHDPRNRATFLRHIAGLLADLGRPEARRFGRAAADLPPLGPADRIEQDLLEVRLRFLDGDVPPGDEIVNLLDALARTGRARAAGYWALQLSHDAGRAGEAAGVSGLRGWALDRLPPPVARSTSETVAARPLGEPFPLLDAPHLDVPPSRRPMVAVRLLRPELQVQVDERPVALRAMEATLLALLVERHPSPLHVEAAHEALWPDRPLRLARLNTVVHRLRNNLGVPAAVVRQGSLLSLDPLRCTTDLWEFRRDLAGAPATRRRALASVRGNLADAQLPYVDPLVDARHRFVATWLDHAAAVAAGDRADLRDAAAALELDAELVSGRCGRA